MVWAKVDDRFPQHPKVVGLDPAAVGVWLMCLCDARARGDSAVPAKLPERYAPGRGAELAAALESCGLWERTETGWLIHDSATYLPPANLSAKRSQAGSKGAATRWQTDGKPMAKPRQKHGSGNPGPVPVPETVLTASTDAVSLSPAGTSLTLQVDELEAGSTQSKPLAKKGETELVFEAWREAGHLNGRAKLTDDRQRKIRARFRDGYTLSDLIDAAEGIWESSWNVEHGQTGLELALRDAAHLERFRDIRRGLRSGREAARGDQMDEINALAESAYRKMQQERLGGLIE